MYKNLFKIFVAVSLFLALPIYAVTKPSPDSSPSSYSYVFYLYYDNGQLFGDRDYLIKYDIVSEPFTPETVGAVSYKVEIVNFGSKVVKTFQFDPTKGKGSAFGAGKINVHGPYVPDGARANFYDIQNRPILTIFISEGSICNGDGFCNNQTGENENICPLECKKATPTPQVSLPSVNGESGPDWVTIATYAVGGLAVIFGTWFGWKRWKKKKEESFPLPPQSLQPPSSLPPSLPSLNP